MQAAWLAARHFERAWRQTLGDALVHLRVAQHDDFVGVSLAGMARKLGLLRGQFEDIEAAASSWR